VGDDISQEGLRILAPRGGRLLSTPEDLEDMCSPENLVHVMPPARIHGGCRSLDGDPETVLAPPSAVGNAAVRHFRGKVVLTTG
jgi:hypothetical protein